MLIPHDLEAGKVLGTPSTAPTSCASTAPTTTSIACARRSPTATTGRFVNVNLRPYYAEGSKTYGYEIQEQLGWRTPAHVVVPMASGSLLDQDRQVDRGIHASSASSRPSGKTKLHGAQAAGCGPIAEAVLAGRDAIKPVKKPKTIAKSLAIGNPADGPYAAQAIRASGGHAAAVSDEEIVDAIKLLASTEGIFTETAGGVTVATAKRLIAEGRIPPTSRRSCASPAMA